jgi:hypothetical protein
MFVSAFGLKTQRRKKKQQQQQTKKDKKIRKQTKH